VFLSTPLSKEVEMPYTNTLTLLETEGGGTTRDVTARLWMIWAEAGDGDRQSEEGLVDFTAQADASTATTFTFPGPASFASVSRDVGLSIQDRSGVVDEGGWLFRSGRSTTTLPTPMIEVVGAAVDISQSDIDAMILKNVSPEKPLEVEPATTISSVTAMLAQGALDLTASGVTTATGNPMAFTFTAKLVISPSPDIADPVRRILEFGITNPAIAFTAVGPGVGSAVEADVLNAVSGIIASRAVPDILAQLEQQVGGGVATAVGRFLPGGLPAGVILSIRSAQIRPAGDSRPGIHVRAALGAFGGVLSKLPTAGGNGGAKCPLQTLQTLGYGIAGLDSLRLARDTLLATSLGGRVVARYYEVAPEASALLAAHPGLARRAAQTADEVAAAQTAGRPLSRALEIRCERLLREVAALGSVELRTAAEEVIAAARSYFSLGRR
jgi:hypothetical protein